MLSLYTGNSTTASQIIRQFLILLDRKTQLGRWYMYMLEKTESMVICSSWAHWHNNTIKFRGKRANSYLLLALGLLDHGGDTGLGDGHLLELGGPHLTVGTLLGQGLDDKLTIPCRGKHLYLLIFIIYKHI